MANMIKIGKSLPQTLTEDSSAPGVPSPYRGQHPDDCTLRVAKRFADTGFLKMRTTSQQLGWWENVKTYQYYNCDCCTDLETELIYTKRYMLRAQLEKEANARQFKAQATIDLGPREFTFTYAESWYDTDTDAQNAMRCAVEKLTRYYKDEIIEFHAVGEYTRAGRSHVHGWYHLTGGRKITDKNFRRAWSHWNPKRKLGRGFEGGHHETIRRVSDFAGYTEKHLEEAWLEIHISNAHEEEVNDSQAPSSDHDSPSDSPSP